MPSKKTAPKPTAKFSSSFPFLVDESTKDNIAEIMKEMPHLNKTAAIRHAIYECAERIRREKINRK